MSGTSRTDDLLTLAAARAAADELLTGMRLPLAKGFSLATPHGFDTAVAKLAAELRHSTAASDAEALRAAVRVLDIDWKASTAAQRSAVVREALAGAARAMATAPKRIEAPLGRAADAVVRATRADVRARQRLTIRADLNALDHRAIAYVKRANVLFVRDEYGRRLESFGVRARGIVAHGLERGLGRDDIGADLAAAAERALVDRGRAYWNVVAASFVGEGRSLSQISSYVEAGIDRYVFSAVLDEATTDVCRWMDGKVLQTRDAVRMFERMEANDDPLAIKRERPWVRERMNDDGVRELFVRRGDAVTTLAAVERSGVGVRDDRGSFAGAIDDRDLAPSGISLPPLHGCCRSTTHALV